MDVWGADGVGVGSHSTDSEDMRGSLTLHAGRFSVFVAPRRQHCAPRASSQGARLTGDLSSDRWVDTVPRGARWSASACVA